MRVFSGESWTVEDLEEFWKVIDGIGKGWGITYPRQQIELITAEQMIDVCATIGAPCSYDHWSIGKEAAIMADEYRQGKTGLALELVINSEPSIMYIMENNTLIQQGLVMAHAGIGHGSVFKNNFLFKEWTQPEAILEYMAFGKKYVAECELKYYPERVEELLDICHSLQSYAVSHTTRLSPKNKKKKLERLYSARDEDLELSNTVPNFHPKAEIDYRIRKLVGGDYNFPEENILYFLEKHADLKPWEREILRINRKMAEYFYPQTKTKIVHEGWASFIEKMVFEELYKLGHINEGGYLEFLRNHANVIMQPDYNNLNPYAVGYQIFSDLYRMTINPTEEDLKEYPEICNTKWQESLMGIVKNYNDEDLMLRYLTPNVIRDLKLFTLETDIKKGYAEITGTSKDIDHVRYIASNELMHTNRVPRLEIVRIDTGKRLVLVAYGVDYKKIDQDALYRIEHNIRKLWGHRVDILIEERYI